MVPPKIEVCIEGYNIDQTDFYISHIIDKYNSLNELYKKSCEHIVFLEKECKEGFAASLSEVENRINNKLSAVEKRLSDIENKIGMNCHSNDNISESQEKIDESFDKEERFKADLSSFHSELEDIKSLFTK